jgi:hypothetical protein
MSFEKSIMPVLENMQRRGSVLGGWNWDYLLDEARTYFTYERGNAERIARLEKELERAADALGKAHPVGAVKAIGLLEVGLAAVEVSAELICRRRTMLKTGDLIRSLGVALSLGKSLEITSEQLGEVLSEWKVDPSDLRGTNGVCAHYQELAGAAVDDWDGQSTEDLLVLLMEHLGITAGQLHEMALSIKLEDEWAEEDSASEVPEEATDLLPGEGRIVGSLRLQTTSRPMGAGGGPG